MALPIRKDLRVLTGLVIIIQGCPHHRSLLHSRVYCGSTHLGKWASSWMPWWTKSLLSGSVPSCIACCLTFDINRCPSFRKAAAAAAAGGGREAEVWHGS